MKTNLRKWRKEIAYSVVMLLFVLITAIFVMHVQKKQQISYKAYEIGALTKATELQSETYEIEEGYISKILPETTLEDLKSNLDESEITVYKQDNTKLEDDELVGTGMKLFYGEKEYKLSVSGDINGDGRVKITDLIKINLSNIGITEKLVNEYKKAGDMNENGTITITDVTRVNLALVNIIDIIAPSTFNPEVKATKDTITVQGNAMDTNSGVKEYWFELDKEGWVTNEDRLKNTYTFRNLESNTEYTVRMKVIDNEGNVKITKRVGIETLNTENANISIVASTEEWTNQNVIVSINYTSNVAEETNQISIDNGATWQEYEKPIVVEKNMTIRARVINKEGTVIGEQEKAITNIDKTSPEAFRVNTTSTSNTITVEGSTTDTQSGIKAYYFSKDNGVTWQTNTNELTTTYTYTNLIKQTNYSIKMKAIDNVGNEYITDVNSTITKNVEGNIEFLVETWSNYKATNKITTATNYEIQYKVNDGNWTLGTTVENLNHNDVIYARLWDGTNSGNEISKTIKDTGLPEITETTSNTLESITITVNAKDKEWGMPSNIEYEYYIGTSTSNYTSKGKYTSNTYTYTGLQEGTTYCIKVTTQDKAGNIGSIEREIQTIPRYTLTYNANGGTVSPTSTTAAANDAITMPTPSRSYTVTYNVNGGNGVPTQTAEYTFNGWYTSEAGGEKRTYTQMPATNETLYAQWTSAIVTLPTPTKTGYTFEGWYTDSGLSNKVTGTTYTPTQNTTLYAKWNVVTYTITYTLNGGTVATSNTTSYTVETPTFTLNNPTKENYTFTGWTGSNGTTAQTTVTITKGTTGDKEYTANWTGKIYTIALDEQGATRSGTTAVYEKYGEGIYSNSTCTVQMTTSSNKIATPTKSYTVSYSLNGGTLSATSDTAIYTFGGYYTGTQGNGTQLIANTGFITSNFTATKFASDSTLYAKWTSASVTLPTPTKEGYKFVGWCTDSGLTNVITETTYTPTENTTLYAKWEEENGIYVNLYTDGTLAFSSNSTLMSDRTLSKSYGNIQGKSYISINSTPWKEERTSINTVNFVNQIMPTSTNYWFYDCVNLTTLNNINNLDTSKVSDMVSMFEGCSSLTSLDLSNFDTSNVTDMSCMFYGCSRLTNLEVSNFDTSNVTDMAWMFNGCASLTTLDLSNFDTHNVTKMNLMFYRCWNLTNLDVSNFDTSNVTGMSCMFEDCRSLTSLDVSGFNTSNVTDMYSMFYNCRNLTSLDVSKFDTSNVTDMHGMFYDCSSLTSLDVSNFNTSNVTDMTWMFCYCRNLTRLDVSNFDTTNVTDIYWMFRECSSLTSLDVSNFDISNVTNMDGVFWDCSNLKSLNVSNFNTSNVTNMDSIFSGCSSLTSLNVSKFDTSNVTDMGSMFSGCSSLTSLNVSNFDTSKVADMSYMFSSCSSLTSLNVSNFDTSKVTDMSYMFLFCSSLTSIDLSNFDTSNVTDMTWMFYYCTKLTTIYVSKNNWITTQADTQDMFYNCGTSTVTKI